MGDDMENFDRHALVTDVNRVFTNYRTIVIDSNDRAFRKSPNSFYKSGQLNSFGSTFVLKNYNALGDQHFRKAAMADASSGKYYCIVKLAVVIQTCALKCIDCHERAAEMRSHISNLIKNVLDQYMTGAPHRQVLVYV